MVQRALVALMSTLLLAGCTGGGGGGKDDAAPGDEMLGDGTIPTLTSNTSVQAPAWEVGQWWEWETTFGTDVADYTFCSIVLTGGDGERFLVTENEDMSKGEAAFGHPLLGQILGDLTMVGWGHGGFNVLSFPLEDGKTWTSTVPNIAWDVIDANEVDLEMSATFDDSIGEAGGFRIMGHYEDGMLMEGEYDPTTGWFAGLRFFDVDEGEEGLEVGFRAKSVGMNYTGPYFAYAGEVLLHVVDGWGFDDVPTEGGEPFAQPSPHNTFTMAADTVLYGVIEVEAAVGGKVATLIDPENGHREIQATGDLEGGNEVLYLDEASMAGDWRIATAGGGGYNSMQAWIFELTPNHGAFA